MNLERVIGWESLLFAYLQDKVVQPFVWGTNDCCTFAAGAIQDITGESVFEPSYSNAFEAQTFMESVGSIEAWMTDKFGEPVARLLGRRGDIALLSLEDRDLLSVVIGDQVVAPGSEHALFYAIEHCTKVWRIG